MHRPTSTCPPHQTPARRLVTAALTLLLPVVSLGFVSATAFGTERVAGKTIDEYSTQLGDENRVVRLRAIWSLGAFGETAAEAITKALDHDDAAVRYTAAVHLGRLGGEPLEQTTETLERLAEKDTSRSVRMAASYALCAAGHTEDHLTTLIAMLEVPERGMACSAADLLGQLGDRAAPAVPALEQAYEANRPGGQGDYHLGGAAQNALRKIRGAAAE